MIPRRARIKVAAKIPVRRKIETQTPENEEKTEISEIDHDKSVKDEVSNSIQIEKPLHEEKVPNIVFENVNSNNDASPITSTAQEIQVKNETNIHEIAVNNSATPPKNVPVNRPITRRWVPKPKPLVSLGAINRRSKPTPTLNSSKEPAEDCIKNQNIENEKPPNIVPLDEAVAEVLVQVEPVVETQIVVSDTKNNNNNIRESSIKSGSDSEKNTTNPLSTSKLINRARIRPVPKFIRRNSVQGSASESEDDGRRTNSRIRTDSVCSTTSVNTEQSVNKDGINISKEKNISTKLQKLTRKSDQTRKVAEARKEFYTKFGGQTKPDKKRLTMMDLIYYNPITNPMPQKRKQSLSEPDVTTIVSQLPVEKEEMEDDPDEIKDEEDINPVPQVKVGPNGEIILDEQSLVIEQTGMKKGRELIANSKIIDGDDQNRAYGIYKRPKRAKEWNAIETLRFYRTLNRLGTDFSMMVSLFPGRTRRDLKVKFKKEERLNHHLIDKALTNPNEFRLEELEEQARKEQETINRTLEKEIVLRKVNSNETNSQKSSKPKKRTKSSKFARCMDERTYATPKKRKAKKTKRDLYSYLEKGMNNAFDSDSESDEEFVPKYKIIKVGEPITRLPRLTKSQTEPIYSDDDDDEEEENASADKNDEHNNNEKDVTVEVRKDVAVEIETENIEAVQQKETDNVKLSEEILPVEINSENTEPALKQTTDDIEEISEEEIEESPENSCEDLNESGESLEEPEGQPSDEEDNTETEKEKKTNQEPEGLTIPNILPNNMSTVEPGSLMILSSVGPDGRPVYKVFMVTPNQNKLPVNLSQDVVQSLANSLGPAESVTLDLPVVNESPVVDESPQE